MLEKNRFCAQPDALVIGPMKSGSTWISEYLSTRKDVCLPRGVKETFYFDRNYAKDFRWYLSHFKHYDSRSHRRIVEVGPSYFHCEAAPQRIRSRLGEIPLIIVLRDPVARSWSHYQHLRRKGYTRSSLEDACNEFPEIIEASLYHKLLNRWLNHFPEEKLVVLRQEKLAKDSDDFAAEVCRSLDIEFSSLSTEHKAKSNEASEPASLVLAKLGTIIGNLLRRYRIYWAVNIAKNLGLKTIFYGKPGKTIVPKISDRERAWLEEKTAFDYRQLPRRFHWVSDR